MLKNLLCRFFLRRNVKASPKILMPPHKDASLKAWSDFVDNAHWKDVQKIYLEFIPRAYEPYTRHDDEVWKILWHRLFLFEQPVLTQSFRLENAGRFVFVEDGASVSLIKDEVYRRHAALLFPKFVVEESGKLRGFALSGELIIVGITLLRAHPGHVEKEAKRQGVCLLTREDSKCVEENLSALNKMMEEVAVPSLKDVRAWLTVQPESAQALYHTYDLGYSDRIGYLEDDDMTYLLGKL